MKSYFKNLLLISVLLVSCLSCTKEDKEENVWTYSNPPTVGKEIRIASYNMRFEWGSISALPEEQRWSSRIHTVKHILRDGNIDIIGSNELCNWQMKQLMDDMPEYTNFGMSVENNGSPIDPNEDIIYRITRFDLLEHGDFWFSSTPLVPGSKDGAGGTAKCTWGKFLDKESGREFYLFNSHFPPGNDNQPRIDSSDILMEQVGNIVKDGTMVFLTGDLNAQPQDEALQRLYRNNWIDTRDVAKEKSKTEGTFCEYTLGKLARDWRIDHVLYNHGVKEVLKHQVVDEEMYTGRWGSDHLPVVVDIILE